jgi:hypothetical protein
LYKVFFRGDILVRHASTVRTPLAKCASDHLPLVIDFHLASSVPAAALPPGNGSETA